jgi:hypothetical protein
MEPELKKSIIEHVLGKRSKLEIEGPPRVLAVIYEAVEASKDLLKNLREGKDMSVIRSSLDRRQRAADRFKSVTGEDWDV